MNLEYLTDEQVQIYRQRMMSVYQLVTSDVARGWVISETEIVRHQLHQLGIYEVPEDPRALYEALRKEQKERAF